MDLYHATDIYFEEFDPEKAKDFKDFGKGYYLTSNLEQALSWARNKGKITETSYVYRYSFIIEDATDLSIKELIEYNEEWVRFLRDNRILGLDTPYDLVYDRMADSTFPNISKYLNDYDAGIISENDVIAKLRIEDVKYDQYCFKTERAREYLKNRKVIIQHKNLEGNWEIYTDENTE